jgi:hypothetical protein
MPLARVVKGAANCPFRQLLEGASVTSHTLRLRRAGAATVSKCSQMKINTPGACFGTPVKAAVFPQKVFVIAQTSMHRAGQNPATSRNEASYMSILLERIKGLMGRCDVLPSNMSRTEITHYAMEVLKRLKRGENIETLELYLRRINASNSRQSHVSAATHELAERAFVLFNSH